MLRKALVPLIAAGVLAPAAAADAQRPAGSWTKLLDDGFTHYACKDDRTKRDTWTVRVRSVAGAEYDGMQGFGTYGALARGSDDQLVDEVSRRPGQRDGDTITMRLKGARNGDRVWVQTAAYGPAAPWKQGTGVRSIKRCA